MKKLLLALVAPAILFSGLAKANVVDTIVGFSAQDSYTAQSNIVATGVIYDNGGVVTAYMVNGKLTSLNNEADPGDGSSDGTSFFHQYIFNAVANTAAAISTTIENTLGGASSAFSVNLFDLTNSIDLGTTDLVTGLNQKSATVALNMIAGDDYQITLAGDTGTARNTSNYTLKLQVVPVPAAVWLFGTALIGFVGMSRRRKVA